MVLFECSPSLTLSSPTLSSPTPLSPTLSSLTLSSPTLSSLTLSSLTLSSPTPLSPTPLSPTLSSLTLSSPTLSSPTPLSPTLSSLTLSSPTPLSPTLSSLKRPSGSTTPPSGMEDHADDFIKLQMALPSAHDRECTAESAPVLPPRPAVSVPARPPAAADQIRRRFEDQRRPPGPRVADSPPRVATRAESAVRSGALAEPHRGRSPRRRTPEPRDERCEGRREDRRERRSPRRQGSRSRSPGRRSPSHRSPSRHSPRCHSPARRSSGRRSPARRSPRESPVKRQRRHSPLRRERSPALRPRSTSRPQSPARSWSNSRGRRGSRGGRGRGGGGRQSASDFARALERLPDVLATALRESQAATACRSVPPDAPRSLPAIVEVANRAVSPQRSVQQPPVLPGLLALAEAQQGVQALARVLRSTRASMPISRPSTFAEKPQAACLGAADEILSLLAPLQAAPSPGADAANLLARAALDLRHIAGSVEGTPGDALTACVSVVRHLWQTTRGMLSFLGADRIWGKGKRLGGKRLSPPFSLTLSSPTLSSLILSSPTLSSPTPLSPTLSSLTLSSPTLSSPTPLSPTLSSLTLSSPTLSSPTPLSPTLSSLTLSSPTLSSPTPLSPTLSSLPLSSPTLSSPTPLSPTLSSLTLSSPTLSSLTLSSPTLSSPTPLSPTLSSLTISSPTLSSPTPLSPTLSSLTLSSPTLSSPTLSSPTPLSPTLLSHALLLPCPLLVLPTLSFPLSQVQAMQGDDQDRGEASSDLQGRGEHHVCVLLPSRFPSPSSHLIVAPLPPSPQTVEKLAHIFKGEESITFAKVDGMAAVAAPPMPPPHCRLSCPPLMCADRREASSDLQWRGEHHTVEKLAQIFKGEESITFAKVDADNNGMLAHRFKITEYPFFKFFTKTNKYGEDLKGDLLPTLTDLVHFVNHWTGTTQSASGVPLDKGDPLPTLTDLVHFVNHWTGTTQSASGVPLDKDLKSDPLPTLTDLVHFVNHWTGTTQSASGVPLDKVGRIAELDAMAGTFLQASEAERQKAMEHAMGVVVAPAMEEHGVFYQKVMKSIVEQGEEYVGKEHARLSKLLAGSLKPDKVEKLSAHRNILEAFKKP
ncbi:unnamed protein product [Closterium sp. Naga37s-1]|nr:unnamed protein product [Closterium sp. Naga37s-1]